MDDTTRNTHTTRTTHEIYKEIIETTRRRDVDSLIRLAALRNEHYQAAVRDEIDDTVCAALDDLALQALAKAMSANRRTPDGILACPDTTPHGPHLWMIGLTMPPAISCRCPGIRGPRQ